MVVYLTAAAAALFYALNLPIRFAFSLNIGELNLFKLGIGLFGARYIYEKPFPITSERAHQVYQKYDHQASAPALKAALRAGAHFLRHARFSGARLSLRLGTGNSAHTALICGSCWAVVHALNATGKVTLPAKISPDFEHRGINLSAGGMVYVCLGHIMYAALVGACDLVSGRIQKKWTGIQLKAS